MGMTKKITPEQIERQKQQAEEFRSNLSKGDGDGDALDGLGLLRLVDHGKGGEGQAFWRSLPGLV